MLKTGKLPNELLQQIVLRHIRPKRAEVLKRPGVGEDCAVIDFGSADCVMSTDPITASATGAGALAVHVSCNDIASNGVAPLGIMLTLLLPEGTDEEGVEEIMRQAAEAADELNVDIIGGHTEITAAVNKPVIVSTAIGKAVKGSVKHGADLKPGDAILLTKLAGLEGTGIIAGDFREELSGILTEEEISEGREMLSMVSVVREGVVAGEAGFSAMHDVTEGGVLGAVWEICQIAGRGAVLYEEDIPVAAVTQKICAHFHMDPLRLISSGAMLIVAGAEETERLETAIRNAGVRVTRIGEIRELSEGITLVKRDGSIISVDPPASDEIYKL